MIIFWTISIAIVVITFGMVFASVAYTKNTTGIDKYISHVILSLAFTAIIPLGIMIAMAHFFDAFGGLRGIDDAPSFSNKPLWLWPWSKQVYELYEI